MLAVLALIGILSLIAVTGILYAFNKHKANAIIQDVSLTAAVVITNEAFLSVQDEQQIINAELPESSLSGFPVTPFRVNADIFVITVQNVPPSVCKHVMTGPNPSDFLIEVNGAVAKENPKNLCTNDTNTMNFYFDASQNAERCGGQICTNGHVCVDDACVCPDDRVDQNGVCVCQNGMEECNGQCYNPCDFSQPGMLGTRDPISCQCQCDQAGGFISDGDRCVCPPEHLLVQNQCKPFGCRGGTSQNNDWTCYIGENRCGTSCTELGDCIYGYCKNICNNPDDFTYMSSMNYYGCKTNSNVICTRNSSSFACEGPEGGQCGSACPDMTGLNCINGDCQNRCETYNIEHGTSLQWMKGAPNGYGCYNPENDMLCGQSWNLYMCHKNDLKYCASGCNITGDICSTNSCEVLCPLDSVYSIVNNSARCTYPDGTWCNGQGICYKPERILCGSDCSGMDINKCLFGVCNENICTEIGYTYTTQFGSRGGCTNPVTGITCLPYNNAYRCYDSNGALCGSNCTGLDGSGCPDCYRSFVCPAGWTSTTAKGISGALENACEKDGIICLEKSQICKANETSCAEGCSLNGQCERGDCTAEQANCPPYMTYGWIATNSWNEVQYFGCIDLQTGIKCYRNGTRYSCFTASGVSCGTGCNIDGSNCTSGLCRCNSGYELINGTCKPISDIITCQAGQCFIGNNPCGAGCQENGTNCDVGTCIASEIDCPTGTFFGKVTNEFYGCINQETYVSCYAAGSTYTCYYKGTLCGTDCQADGTGGSCDTECI